MPLRLNKTAKYFGYPKFSETNPFIRYTDDWGTGRIIELILVFLSWQQKTGCGSHSAPGLLLKARLDHFDFIPLDHFADHPQRLTDLFSGDQHSLDFFRRYR